MTANLDMPPGVLEGEAPPLGGSADEIITYEAGFTL